MVFCMFRLRVIVGREGVVKQYLTIGLRARNFYEVIADDDEVIVLAKTNLCSLFLRNYFSRKTRNKQIFFFLRKTLPFRVTRRYSISI